ncbi:MAG TPA: TonB-dependent receptor [Gemmatimonadales bacterium]|nr:TonB-dependent receptor [Gemmatimonadales bacterium]
MHRSLSCVALTLLLSTTAIALPAQDSAAVGRDTLRHQPRKITSQVLLDSAAWHDLPITELRGLLVLQPGVVESNDPRGPSLRGSDPGATGVFFDGALVQGGSGTSPLLLGTNSIAAATLTTGATAADVLDGEAGALSIMVPSGGARLAASLRYRTDDVGLNWWRNIGFNRVEATAAGLAAFGVRFFGAVTLDGRQSLETQQLRDVQAPVYVASGIDTVVREPVAFGNPSSDTVDFAIPRFVQYSGYCDPARNYGQDCQGLRLPFTANGSLALAGKLTRPYGNGSSVSVTALASRAQARDFPGSSLYDPDSYTGSRVASSAVIANWSQHLGRPERPLVLHATISRQADEQISGMLTRGSELASRDPFGGFLLKPLDFLVGFDATHDVAINGTTYSGVHYLDDRQIQCLLVSTAYCLDEVPYINRDDLQQAQPFRLNPYGVEQSARLPLYTQGLGAGMDLGKETRWQERVGVDWQLDSRQLLRAGIDHITFDTRRYSTGSLISPFGMSAYHEQPVRQGMWIEDRLDLADLTVAVGVRWDRFDSRALYPRTPGRITTDTLPFDPANPTKNFVPAPAHAALSPHVQVGLAVTPQIDVRFSAARQVATPSFDASFQGKNTDLSLTNQFQFFARDLDFTKTVTLELGATGRLRDDWTVDGAIFSKSFSSQVLGGLKQLPDPFKNGTPTDFFLFFTSDVGDVRGAELRIERRVGDWLNGSVAYSYRTLANLPSNLMLPNDYQHSVAAVVALNVPEQWRAGTMLGHALNGTDVFATLRFTTGGRYTRVIQEGVGYTSFGAFSSSNPIEPLNASLLPSARSVDVRITRGLRLGGRTTTLFAESQNLFNWTNVLGTFTETGNATNPTYQRKFLDEQTALLAEEANAAGLGTTDAQGNFAVDLSSPGVCTTWAGRSTSSQTTAASGPVDCVMLVRAEQRYGNGDGIFTKSEYTRAFSAWYNLANAPYRFYGQGRRIRVGLEVGL